MDKKNPPNAPKHKTNSSFTFEDRKQSSKTSRTKSDFAPLRREKSLGRSSQGFGASDDFSAMKPVRKKNRGKGNTLKNENSFALSRSADLSEFDEKTARTIDAESVISQFSVPAGKYRSKGQGHITKNKPLKSEQSLSSMGPRARTFSNALKRSLADMSESVLKAKNSLSIADEHSEKIAHKQATLHVSDMLIRSTVEVPLSELSENYIFGGYSYDDYDVFNKKQQYFVDFYKDAFEELELAQLYTNDEQLVERFLRLVAKNYRNEKQVPFHNFRHGFSVGQVAVTFILRNYHLKKFFDKKTLFTFIVACIVHDVDHPGNDNFYEHASKSYRNKRHGDVATLENHHSDKFIELMKNDGEKNIFKYLDVKNQDIMFEQACDFILSTDMGQHKDKLAILKSFENLGSLMGPENVEDQMELLGCIIHACDLSGQCFDFQVARRWEENIHLEMLNQYNMLMKDSLNLPDHMKRFHIKGQKGLQARYKSQAGFINFLLVPYWTEVVRLMPEMNDFLVNLKKNGEKFSELANTVGKDS